MNKNENFNEIFGASYTETPSTRLFDKAIQKKKKKHEQVIVLCIFILIVLAITLVILLQKKPYPYDITEPMLQKFFTEKSNTFLDVQSALRRKAFNNLSIKYQNGKVHYFSDQKSIEIEDAAFTNTMLKYFQACESADFRSPSIEYSAQKNEIRFLYFFFLEADKKQAARAGISNSSTPPSLQVKENNYSGKLGDAWYYYRYALAPSPEVEVRGAPPVKQ